MASPRIKELAFELRRFVAYWRQESTFGATAFILAIAAGLFSILPPGVWLALQTQRIFYEIRGPIPPPADVVIVGLPSRNGMQQKKPFPRRKIANALEKIADVRPRTLILDIALAKRRGSAKANRRIAQALRRVPSTIWTSENPKEKGPVIGNAPPIAKAARMQVNMNNSFRSGMVAELERNQSSDEEQRIPLMRPLRELAGYKIETPPRYSLINYYGPRGTIQHLSLTELQRASPKDVKEKLHGKVVVFGLHQVFRLESCMTVKDEYFISGSFTPMYGAEIHANKIGNLIDRSWKRAPGPILEVIGTIIVTILGVAAIFVLSPLQAAIGALFFLLCLAVGSYVAFVHHGIWIGNIALLSIVLSFALFQLKIFRYIKESRLVDSTVAATGMMIHATRTRLNALGRGSKLALIFFIALLFALFDESSLGRGLQKTIVTGLYHLRGAVQPPKDIALIVIDHDTYVKLKLDPALPFPNSAWRRGMKNLQLLTPRAIVSDIEIDRFLAGFPISKLPVRTYREEVTLQDPAVIASATAILRDAKYSINAPSDGEIAVNFYGPRGTIPSLSFSKLLEEDQSLLRSKVRGKVVVLGFANDNVNRASCMETVCTPAGSERFYKSEIQASLLGNVLQRTWLTPLPKIAARIWILFMSATFLFCGFVFNPGRYLRYLSVLAIVFLGAAYILFVKGYLLPGVVTLLFVGVGGGVLSLIRCGDEAALLGGRLRKMFRFRLVGDR